MKRRIISAVLCLMLVFALTACGKDGNTQDTSEKKNEVTSVTGEVVKAEIPSGWCIVTSTEMTGASGEDFICHAQKYEVGTAYLQVVPDSRDISAIKQVLESADPFGAYSGEVKLAHGTWYIAENAAAAVIGGKSVMVKGYACDFGSDEVLSILGSLQWIE